MISQPSSRMVSGGCGNTTAFRFFAMTALSLGCLLATLPVRATEPVRSASVELGSDDRDLGEVIQLLKSRYADPSAVTETKIGNASLSALLNQLGGGATLMAQPGLNPVLRPMSLELLAGKIGYWRAATFKPARDWAQVESQLNEWQKSGVAGIIVDLRDFESSNDYTGAARVASLFISPGETLFTVQGLQIPQQIYRSANTSIRRQLDMPLVVLTNRRTVGAAEALAVVLRQRAKAILVGRSTGGQAGYFSEWKLSSGRYLRLATGQAMLGDGTQLFGKPVVPDIALYIDDQLERQALEESSQSGSAGVTVQELTPRARTSEAALVHGDNPELDEMLSLQLAAKDGGSGKSVGRLQDVALIRSMDVVRSIQFAMSQSQSREVLTSSRK